MSLFARVQELTINEQSALMEILAHADISAHEARTVFDLLRDVLEEHNALSEELSKNGAYRSQAYTKAANSAYDRYVTTLASASMPFVSTLA